MKIRNARETRMVVPALAIEADPDEEVRVPHDATLPEGFERVEAPAPDRSRKKSTVPPAAAADNEEEKV